MDPSDFPPSRSPRKELQGPRPTPLKIHKDSHKIRKPPVPQPHHPSQLPGPHNLPPRQPVIIYTVSPKIIHTNPSDFMNLVQRLTGLSSSSSSSSEAASNTTTTSTAIATTTNPSFYAGGAISPAARYATIEKANSPPQRGRNMIDMRSSIGINPHDQHAISTNVFELGLDHQIETSFISNNNNNSNNKGFFSGILSPGPASLPPIAPSFFSPPSDGFFQDLSPAIQYGNRNFMEGSFMPSPAANFSSLMFSSPRNFMTSPTTPSLDHLLNNIFSDNIL